MAGYIEKSTITSIAFTFLIFALTVQNFFIFRNFWNKVGVNGTDTNFSQDKYDRMNFINFGNDLENNYQLPSASLFDAIGAALAMYSAYSAVVGRIGLGEVFFLTWIGTFIYECNSQILWRLWILDSGYPSRAFAYGGTLGIVSSFVLGKRELTEKNENYRSNYRQMSLSLLGTVFVWCLFPLLVLGDVYVSTTGKIVTMSGQVNIWLALAGSAIGAYNSAAFVYRKFSLHDLVFSAITVRNCLFRVALPIVRQLTSTITLEPPWQLGSEWALFVLLVRLISRNGSTEREYLIPTAFFSNS